MNTRQAWLARAGRFLLQPSSHVRRPVARRAARLMAGLFLSGFVLVAVNVIVLRLVPLPFDFHFVWGGGLAMLAGIGVAYGLSRTRYYQMAIWVFTLFMDGLVVYFMGWQPSGAFTAVYLVVPLLLASLFFELRRVLFLALANFFLFLALWRFSPPIFRAEQGWLVLGAFVFLIMIGSLILAVTRNREEIEKERQESLRRSEINLQRQNRVLTQLYRAGEELSQSLDPPTTYHTVYRIMQRVMPCDTLMISRYERETQSIYCLYSIHDGTRQDVSRFPPLPLEPRGSGTQSRAIRSGQSLLINDYQAALRRTQSVYHADDEGKLHADPPEEKVSHSALIVPLKLENKVEGVVQIFSYEKEAYTPRDLSFLETLAPQITAAIINARLYAQAQREIQERKAAEAALQASEARLRMIFDQANDWIFTLDAQGHIASVNRQMCLDSGYAASELLGYHPAKFLNERSATEVEGLLAQMRRDDSVDSAELAVPLRNGRTIWLEIRGRSLYQDGRFSGTLHIARDITERKRAAAAEQQQRQLAETLRQIAAFLNSTLDRDALLDQVLAAVNRVVSYDAAEIMLLADDVASIVRHQGYEQFDAAAALEEREFPLRQFDTLRHMAETGEPLAIPDVDTDPRWRSMPGLDWIRSFAGAPLQREASCIGFIHVASAAPGRYHDAHAHRLKALSEHIANAIRNATLYETEQRRRAVAETLQRAAAVLNSTLSLDDLLTTILAELGNVIPYDSASVQERQGDTMVIKAVHGFTQPDDLIGVEIPLVPYLPDREIVYTRQSLALADVGARYPRFSEVVDGNNLGEIRSWLGAPLLVHESVIGLITLDRYQVSPFSEDEINLATTFAHQAAIALQNARLYLRLADHSKRLEQAVAARTAALHHTTEQVQAILRNSPDAIIVLDPDFRLEMHNPAFTDLFGYERETIPATFPACLVSGDQRGKLMQALNAVLERDEPFRLTLTARHRDGSVFDADMALAPVYQDESVQSIVCSLRDITLLKQVERLKDEFVANVSHELRTPITSLKLYHDLIRRNPKKQDVYLDRLGREISRLNILVEDLLRLSRLDQNRVNWEIQPVDLNELARQYVVDRRPLATERAVQLQLDVAPSLPPVTADASMVGQALSVLLTNAINYTPQEGIITVQTCSREGKVGVRVEDTGPGISPEEQALVFHRFYRGQSGRASGAPGTGLGLSIAQEIVEWHNGRIEIESEMGQGSAFTIWLPLETETEEA